MCCPLHQEDNLHGYQDSNSEQRFWRPTWYHFTIPVEVEVEGFEPPMPTAADLQSAEQPIAQHFQWRSRWESNSLRKFCRLSGRHDQPDHCAVGELRYLDPMINSHVLCLWATTAFATFSVAAPILSPEIQLLLLRGRRIYLRWSRWQGSNLRTLPSKGSEINLTPLHLDIYSLCQRTLLKQENPNLSIQGFSIYWYVCRLSYICIF